MEVVESLPARPLTLSEVDALADADGIDGLTAVTLLPDTEEAVIVGFAKESSEVLVGYRPESAEWVVLERWDREWES